MSSAAKGLFTASRDLVITLGKKVDKERAEIAKNESLSDKGRQTENGNLDVFVNKELAELKGGYQGGLAKLRADLQSAYAGLPPKRSYVDRVRHKGMYEETTNREVALANAESAETIVRAIQDMTRQNIAAALDQKGLSAAMESAYAAGDQNALHNLGEVARFRGDQDGIKRAQGYVDALREASLTPSQKIARLELERLDLHEARFDQAVEFARKGGKALELLENIPVETERDRAIDAQIQAIKLGFESKQTEGGND
jgi:hypothetical protein